MRCIASTSGDCSPVFASSVNTRLAARTGRRPCTAATPRDRAGRPVPGLDQGEKRVRVLPARVLHRVEATRERPSYDASLGGPQPQERVVAGRPTVLVAQGEHPAVGPGEPGDALGVRQPPLRQAAPWERPDVGQGAVALEQRDPARREVGGVRLVVGVVGDPVRARGPPRGVPADVDQRAHPAERDHVATAGERAARRSSRRPRGPRTCGAPHPWRSEPTPVGGDGGQVGEPAVPRHPRAAVPCSRSGRWCARRRRAGCSPRRSRPAPRELGRTPGNRTAIERRPSCRRCERRS